MKYLIRVPATTANLGPGFDCLGLALDLWNDLEVSVEGHGLSIEIHGFGADLLPTDQKNVIYSAMHSYAIYHEKEIPKNLKLVCTNRIPLGSGLGSSSAAIVSGILAASAVLGMDTDIQDQLTFAAKIEDHPDNVAPCLMGGLVASVIEDNRVVTSKLPVSEFNLVLVHPFFEFPTHEAREVLPTQISHKDAVFNASHAIFAIEALRNGDLALLKVAMQDRLHQPYRLNLIPGANNAIIASQSIGAIATILSGAGPSLLAFSPNKEKNMSIANAIQTAFSQAGLSCEVFYPNISLVGASIASKKE